MGELLSINKHPTSPNYFDACFSTSNELKLNFYVYSMHADCGMKMPKYEPIKSFAVTK